MNDLYEVVRRQVSDFDTVVYGFERYRNQCFIDYMKAGNNGNYEYFPRHQGHRRKV